MQIKLLESDYLVSYKDAGIANLKKTAGTVQGVRINDDGKVISYYIYESHPGDIVGSLNVLEFPAEQIDHIYRQDRPGQFRGVSWFHSILRQLEDFNEFQQATLISRKISACFSAFITTNNEDSTLSSSDLIAKRETESMLTPGSIRYLSQGEGVQLAAPPAIAGYDEYCRQTLRAIASGLGVTYEALTADYSQVNYSSGRMGHLEFRRNVEMWRWNMLIPQFCEPSFRHFLKWCSLRKGIDIDGVTVEWVPPAWSMIDPAKEIEGITAAIRSGLTSLPKAQREQGYDPEELSLEISESNQNLDTLGIVLDSDPRKITKAGQVQMDPQQKGNSSNGDNQKVPENGTPSQSN